MSRKLAALLFLLFALPSAAAAGPISRVMKNEPPESGIRPMLMNAGTNDAASDAIRMSQAHAKLRPAPAAGPFTAASTGFSSSRTALIVGW